MKYSGVTGLRIVVRIGEHRQNNEDLHILEWPQAAEHYVCHCGLHAESVAKLAPRLQALVVCPRSWRMKDAILEFLSDQPAATRPGERLIAGRAAIESSKG